MALCVYGQLSSSLVAKKRRLARHGDGRENDMSKCNHDFVHRVPNCIAPSIAPHWACNVCKQQFVLPSHGADAEARAVMWKDAYDRESTANAALREQLEELHGALNRSEMRCRKIGSENSKMVEREITLQNQLSELHKRSTNPTNRRKPASHHGAGCGCVGESAQGKRETTPNH